MKSKIKVLLCMLVLCFTLSGLTAAAADDRLGTVVGGSLLTDDGEVTYDISSLARGSFLANGTGGLSIAGSRYLAMSGATTCYNYVDQLNVSLMLQRLVGNQWVYVAELPTKTAYNDYYVSKSGYKTVAGGYYYRIYGGHVAHDNGAMESLTSYSDGIWVD